MVLRPNGKRALKRRRSERVAVGREGCGTGGACQVLKDKGSCLRPGGGRGLGCYLPSSTELLRGLEFTLWVSH